MERNRKDGPWRIRKACERDRAALEAVVAEAFALYVPRMSRKPYPLLDDYAAYIRAGQAFVLEEGRDDGAEGPGAIRACIVLVPGAEGELSLEVLAVRRDCQGRGHGRALVDFALREARAFGARRLRLYTNEVMREAQAFYTRLGFTETHRALDAGYHRVFYELELPGAEAL